MEPQPIDILLVDDEPRNLDALEVILAAPGYRLIRALNGDAALAALLQHDIAAMVLDIRMPDLSGVELARIIKGTKKFREIPILFLTAHLLDDQDIVAGYGAGAVDYLTKPVNPLVFRHKIAVFAELFRKTRALAATNLAPHIESTRKRGWIDGFVAACEAFRGLDEMPDVTEVLRETVGQHFTPRDEAFLTMDAEGLARWLFYRAAGAYDKSPARLAETWADEKVQQHWRDEAESIIGFLANGE